MMDPFGVAGHLGADHAIGVAVGGGTPHLADAVGSQLFDLQGAGAWAIMGADGRNEGQFQAPANFQQNRIGNRTVDSQT